MKVFCIFFSIVLAIRADYHDEVGIQLAKQIKAYEDRVMAEEPDMESRIVGGHVASLGAHPYLVGLIKVLLDGLTISASGSSLISSTRLVTAAHCLDRIKSIEAVLGSQYLFYGGTRINTTDFVLHSDFNRNNSYYSDIGVVFLPTPVTFSDIIQPVGLPKSLADGEVIGEYAIASGYGKTKDMQNGVGLSSVISEVRLKIIPTSNCKNTFGMTKRLDTLVCTSGDGGVGTCDGDSGGPLVVDRNGKKLLVGITSFGAVYSENGSPSVFTRVAAYLDYLQKYL